MIKLLLPLISFFMGSAKHLFKEPSIALTQQLALHVRSIIMMVVTAIGSLTLLCVGISLLINSIGKQMDLNEGFVFTSGMMVYTSLTVVSLGVLIYILNRKTWLNKLGFEERPPAPKQSGALENAVALLVMDYVEERQNRRNQKQEEPA